MIEMVYFFSPFFGSFCTESSNSDVYLILKEHLGLAWLKHFPAHMAISYHTRKYSSGEFTTSAPGSEISINAWGCANQYSECPPFFFIGEIDVFLNNKMNI